MSKKTITVKVSYICTIKIFMSYTLLSSSPQGFTDFRFRNAVNKYFGGIDTYYSPYIRLNGKLVIKSSYERYPPREQYWLRSYSTNYYKRS
jgi:hypothetical protein